MANRLNIELFRKIRDRIQAIPESYNQQVWMTGSTEAPCGTAACIAGEAIICAAPSVEQGVKDLRRHIADDNAPETAADLLGLEGDWYNEDEGEAAIFSSGGKGWAQPYRGMFRRARSGAGRARAAVAYLDHIIETGKVLE